jgi:D-glycero-D-manno-heptose 1,7-bisphosphate phosphatase
VTPPNTRLEPERSRPAVFLDRDGTIIEDSGYLNDPAGVRLLPGSAAAIRQLNSAGLPVIVVSNQSGIARGLLTIEQYRRVETRLEDLLSREGARLDAQYFCPHLPEVSGPCQCRKPGGLLYQQAAARLALDLARSWWVGDRLRDVLPADTFGGRGILIGTGTLDSPESSQYLRARDLVSAVDLILPAPRS